MGLRFFAVFVTVLRLGSAALIASGKIEQCANTGEEEDILSGCLEKIVVSLSLTGGQDETESLYASMESVRDEYGESKRLQTPWSIALSKTAVYHRYPLEYLQSFNAFPYEEVVNPSGLGVFTECDASMSTNTPTCGWSFNADGSKIPHSQGYCCQCDAFSKESSRSQGDCNFWGMGLNPATAHCLRWGELWYASYALGSPETHYNINVALSVDLKTQETLQLSPETPVARSGDGRIAARLIGDFASWKQIEDFDEFLLFVPNLPVTNPRVEGEPETTWMLIRRDDVTFDGLTCNKIGVSYEAFKYETGKCENNPGSCLRNQLEHFHEAGDHFLDNYGKLGMAEDAVAGQIYLSFESEITQTSLVTLTLDATDVKFVINVSQGKFVSCDIADFESMSREGTITCSVRNEGKVKAEFHVSVTDCSNGIKPILGQTKTIENSANATATFIFDVRSENILDSSHFCMVYLYDALYEINDELQVHFTSTVQIEEKGAQGGMNVAKMGKSEKGEEAKYDCKDKCGSLDLVCLFLKGCYEDIGLIVLVAVLIIFGLPILMKLLYRWWKSRMSSSQRRSSKYMWRSSYDERKRHKHRRGKIRRKHYDESSSPSDFSNRDTSSEPKRKRKKRRKRRMHANSASSENELDNNRIDGKKKRTYKNNEGRELSANGRDQSYYRSRDKRKVNSNKKTNRKCKAVMHERKCKVVINSSSTDNNVQYRKGRKKRRRRKKHRRRTPGVEKSADVVVQAESTDIVEQAQGTDILEERTNIVAKETKSNGEEHQPESKEEGAKTVIES